MSDDLSAAPLKWKPDMIAREHGLSKATVYRRLAEAGLTHTEGGAYTRRQVDEALFSSYTAERTKLVRAQKEQAELLLAQMRGELVDKQQLIFALREIGAHVRAVIANSSGLTKQEKADIDAELWNIDVQLVSATEYSQEKAGVKTHSVKQYIKELERKANE
jgi:phage terminase Nu1 subunit (DNA packaging protein)